MYAPGCFGSDDGLDITVVMRTYIMLPNVWIIDSSHDRSQAEFQRDNEGTLFLYCRMESRAKTFLMLQSLQYN